MEPAYANAARAERPLEGIAAATVRINAAAVSLGNFVDRFHGPTPQGVVLGDPIAKDPPPAGYADSLQRLWAAVERMEKHVEAIGQIG